MGICEMDGRIVVIPKAEVEELIKDIEAHECDCGLWHSPRRGDDVPRSCGNLLGDSAYYLKKFLQEVRDDK